MTLPAWILLIPIIMFIAVVVYFTKKACDDLEYCIKHTMRNKATKDWEFEQMKKELKELKK
jgi:hypothetical protein